MSTLRLLEAEELVSGHEGEIFACAFTPDGAYALTGGWDGRLRVWDVRSGGQVSELVAGPKPLSACAVAPNGKYWLTGSMEGLLTVFDAVSHVPTMHFVAHTRPISALCFSPEGSVLATASWDRQVVLRKVGKEREGRALAGHEDIVAGCQFLGNGEHLLSWSHDGTVRLWDALQARELATLGRHDDRIQAASASPDGRMAVSGSRDGVLKVWDVEGRDELNAVSMNGEVRACFFLPDAQSVVAVDSTGWAVLLSAPALEPQADLQTGLKVQSTAQSPTGLCLALGCDDGHVHFVAAEGFEQASLVVQLTRTTRTEKSVLGKLFGKEKVVHGWQYTCPVCHATMDQATPPPPDSFPCPRCRQALRVISPTRQLQR